MSHDFHKPLEVSADPLSISAVSRLYLRGHRGHWVPYLAGKQLELQPQDLVVYQLVPSKLSQGLLEVFNR